MLTVIEQNREAVAGLCRRFNVRRLELFGCCNERSEVERSAQKQNRRSRQATSGGVLADKADAYQMLTI